MHVDCSLYIVHLYIIIAWEGFNIVHCTLGWSKFLFLNFYGLTTCMCLPYSSLDDNFSEVLHIGHILVHSLIPFFFVTVNNSDWSCRTHKVKSWLLLKVLVVSRKYNILVNLNKLFQNAQNCSESFMWYPASSLKWKISDMSRNNS